MSEAEIQASIRLALGRLPHVRLWRSNTGEAWHGKTIERTATRLVLAPYSRITYGLCDGSSDLIGATQVTITPEMVGQRVAIFTAIEVKRPGKHPEPDQRNFLKFVSNFGGIAGAAHSVEEALKLIDRKPA